MIYHSLIIKRMNLFCIILNDERLLGKSTVNCSSDLTAYGSSLARTEIRVSSFKEIVCLH